MSNVDIIRAWRDEDYRSDLSEADSAAVPEHPAGMVALSEAGLSRVTGGSPLPETVHPGDCTLATRTCPSICQVFSC